MDTIYIALISAGATIIATTITAVLGYKQQKLKKKMEIASEEAERKAEQRKRESLLAMELSHANVKLTVGVAMALKRGHANGEIEDGMAAVTQAMENYEGYLREVANEALR